MKVKTIRCNNCTMITTAVVQALAKLVLDTKGNCVALTSRRLMDLVDGNVSISPSVARRVLSTLADKGLIIRYNEKKGKYILCSNSQLWKYLKADDRGSVIAIISSII